MAELFLNWICKRLLKLMVSWQWWSSLYGSSNIRAMVRKRENLPHKCAWTTSNKIDSIFLHQREKRENHTLSDRVYDWIKQRDLSLSSKSQYVYHSRIPAFSTECSSIQGIKKKNRLFRVASSSPSFWRGFSITAFFENRSISFSPMPTCRSLVTETINKWCTLARVTDRPHHGWGQEIENSSKLQPLLWLKMHCLRPDVYDPKAKNWIYFIYFKMVIGLLKNQWHILKFTNKNQQWNLLRVMATNWCQTFTKI